MNGKLKLVPPFIIGDGANFSSMYFYAEDAPFVSVDENNIFKLPDGTSIIVHRPEIEMDFFEDLLIFEARFITGDPKDRLNEEFRGPIFLHQVGTNFTQLKPRRTGASWIYKKHNSQ